MQILVKIKSIRSKDIVPILKPHASISVDTDADADGIHSKV